MEPVSPVGKQYNSNVFTGVKVKTEPADEELSNTGTMFCPRSYSGSTTCTGVKVKTEPVDEEVECEPVDREINSEPVDREIISVPGFGEILIEPSGDEGRCDSHSTSLNHSEQTPSLVVKLEPCLDNDDSDDDDADDVDTGCKVTFACETDLEQPSPYVVDLEQTKLPHCPHSSNVVKLEPCSDNDNSDDDLDRGCTVTFACQADLEQPAPYVVDLEQTKLPHCSGSGNVTNSEQYKKTAQISLKAISNLLQKSESKMQNSPQAVDEDNEIEKLERQRALHRERNRKYRARLRQAGKRKRSAVEQQEREGLQRDSCEQNDVDAHAGAETKIKLDEDDIYCDYAVCEENDVDTFKFNGTETNNHAKLIEHCDSLAQNTIADFIYTDTHLNIKTEKLDTCEQDVYGHYDLEEQEQQRVLETESVDTLNSFSEDEKKRQRKVKLSTDRVRRFRAKLKEEEVAFEAFTEHLKSWYPKMMEGEDGMNSLVIPQKTKAQQMRERDAERKRKQRALILQDEEQAKLYREKEAERKRKRCLAIKQDAEKAQQIREREAERKRIRRVIMMQDEDTAKLIREKEAERKRKRSAAIMQDEEKARLFRQKEAERKRLSRALLMQDEEKAMLHKQHERDRRQLTLLIRMQDEEKAKEIKERDKERKRKQHALRMQDEEQAKVFRQKEASRKRSAAYRERQAERKRQKYAELMQDEEQAKLYKQKESERKKMIRALIKQDEEQDQQYKDREAEKKRKRYAEVMQDEEKAQQFKARQAIQKSKRHAEIMQDEEKLKVYRQKEAERKRLRRAKIMQDEEKAMQYRQRERERRQLARLMQSEEKAKEVREKEAERKKLRKAFLKLQAEENKKLIRLHEAEGKNEGEDEMKTKKQYGESLKVQKQMLNFQDEEGLGDSSCDFYVVHNNYDDNDHDEDTGGEVDNNVVREIAAEMAQNVLKIQL